MLTVEYRNRLLEEKERMGSAIAYIEAGNVIRPIGQDAAKATAEFLARLKQDNSELEAWIASLAGLVESALV